MGGSSTKVEAPAVIEEGGLHIFEFHLPTFFGTVVTIIIIGGICLLLFLCFWSCIINCIPCKDCADCKPCSCCLPYFRKATNSPLLDQPRAPKPPIRAALQQQPRVTGTSTALATNQAMTDVLFRLPRHSHHHNQTRSPIRRFSDIDFYSTNQQPESTYSTGRFEDVQQHSTAVTAATAIPLPSLPPPNPTARSDSDFPSSGAIQHVYSTSKNQPADPIISIAERNSSESQL